MNSENRKKIIAVVITLLVLGLLGWAVYRGTHRNTPISSNDIFTVPEQATSTGQNGGGVVVEPVVIPVPDLNRILVPDTKLPTEAKNILIANMVKVSEQLKKDPKQARLWIALGTNRKMAGDYEGARLAWEYVDVVSAGNVTAFANLGDLYHYNLKNYPKAELNMKKVIALSPTDAGAYKALFDLYHLSYLQSTHNAEKVLLAGLVKIPHNLALTIELASYYKEKGMKEKAITYYDEAIATAKSHNNQDLVTELEAQRASI